MSGFSQSPPQSVAITPVFGMSGGGASLGNGTIAGSVTKLGANLILASVKMTLGSTTTITTGYIYFTLPAPYSGTPTGSTGNVALFQDASAGANFIGSAIVLTGLAQIIAFYGNNATNPTSPFTWAVGDLIELSVLIQIP